MATNSDIEILLNHIKQTRRQLLDILDVAYRNGPQWPFVRSRILKLFGRDGLEGAVRSLPANHAGSIGSIQGTNCPSSRCEHDESSSKQVEETSE